MSSSGNLNQSMLVGSDGRAEKTEFVFEQNGAVLRIDTAEPDRALHNMLYNPNYLTLLDQNNCGMAKHMSVAGRTCTVV